MITAVYASLSAFWLTFLVLQVVKQRRANQVKYADGGVHSLQVARSAHANAAETLPMALILLFCLEYQGASTWLVHLLGVALLVGRVMHGRAILADRLKGRKEGMVITLLVILTTAVLNLVLFVI